MKKNRLSNARAELKARGIRNLRIVSWELDQSQLGIEIEWDSGQFTAFCADMEPTLKEWLCGLASAASS